MGQRGRSLLETKLGFLRDSDLPATMLPNFRNYDYGSYFRHRRSSRSPSPTAGIRDSSQQGTEAVHPDSQQGTAGQSDTVRGMAPPGGANAIPPPGGSFVGDVIPLFNAYANEDLDLETISVHTRVSDIESRGNMRIPPLKQ